MSRVISYCAFYSVRGAGFAGQRNLSHPLRDTLARAFDLVDVSPVSDEVTRFPGPTAVIGALHRLLLARKRARGGVGVTVVDMVHSLTALPNSHAGDRLIILGHDSYSLRAWRELAATRGLGARARLVLSGLGWSYVELLLRQLAWKSFFVSPIDMAHAATGRPAGLVAIPVPADLRAAGARLRAASRTRRDGAPRILVSLPVINPAQNRIDCDLVARLVRATSARADVTLWGRGASPVAQALGITSDMNIVDWVDDYVGFLAGFDLLVYSRLIGSGFHTKLAEALVLGVPCLCAEWVAAPLRAAGYDGLATFTNADDFEPALRALLQRLGSPMGLPFPIIPVKAEAEAALEPLVTACSEALQTL